jgi:hypothetical protein
MCTADGKNIVNVFSEEDNAYAKNSPEKVKS